MIHCLFMRQTQGLCSAITVFMEPQDRQERCLLRLIVRGSGTLFDGKRTIETAVNDMRSLKESEEPFHLYQIRRNYAIQIRFE